VAEKTASVVLNSKGADCVRGSGGGEDSWCVV